MGKYNVGDKVRIISKRGVAWNYDGEMDKYCGTVMTIREVIGDLYQMEEDKNENNGMGWYWSDRDFVGFAGVFTKDDLKNGDIILRNNGEVEIAIVDRGVFVSARGWMSLNNVNEDLTHNGHDSGWDIKQVRRPTSEGQCQFCAFSYEWGELVYDRERDTKPLYNGKVVCIDAGNNDCYTVGKIYQFKDGQLTANSGKQFPKGNTLPSKSSVKIHNFEDWKDWSTAKWLEIKE